MTWPRDIPFDPARKRYYLFDESLRHNPSDYALLNELEIYPNRTCDDGEVVPITAGPRKYVAPGRTTQSSYGLPALLAKPRVLVARRNRPLDIYGFLKRRLVSSRAKQLLCEIDPGGFDFAECNTVTRAGRAIEPYWLMDVARLAPPFDEARSVFELRSIPNSITDAWRARGFLGADFQPLQLPTPRERTQGNWHGNYAYWRRGGFREQVAGG